MGNAMVNTATVRTTCSYRCRVLRHRVFTNATVHNRTCDLVFCIYHSSLSILFSSLLRFLRIRARVYVCTYVRACSPPSSPPARAFRARISLAWPPSLLNHHPSVTCGMDRRKGVRETVGGDGKGREKGFKRVNTSQLRSQRTLLGHWSDRDVLHPFPLRPPLSLLAWFSPLFGGALSSEILHSVWNPRSEMRTTKNTRASNKSK